MNGKDTLYSSVIIHPIYHTWESKYRVIDNKAGKVICICESEAMSHKIARLLNKDVIEEIAFRESSME